MSRTIKFRAWVPKYKEMFTVAILSWNQDGSLLIKLKEHMDADFYRPGAAEIQLMQFTGLTDMHDTEIYEGDIVKFAGYSQDEKFTSQIIFDQGIFRPKMWSEPLGFYKSKEVIGNIYEHPELVKRSRHE